VGEERRGGEERRRGDEEEERGGQAAECYRAVLSARPKQSRFDFCYEGSPRRRYEGERIHP